MTLSEILRLIPRNWLLLLAVTVVTAASIFYFTKDQDDEYTSSTTIYTGIVTGYNLSNVSGTSSQNRGASGAYASNLVSILESRELRNELGFRLLASHLMLNAPDPSVIGAEYYNKLQEAVPNDVKSKVVGATVEETTKNISDYYYATPKNAIRSVINSDEFGYSAEAFTAIEPKRVGESDLLEIEYTSSDPALTKNTLEILTQLFIEQHRNMFTGQSETVVAYFEKATQDALQNLRTAEDNLLAFQKENNLIDYESQVEATTSEKNALLGKYNELEIEYAGAMTNLNSLERGLKDRGVPNLYSREVLQLKSKLSGILTEIAELELLN